MANKLDYFPSRLKTSIDNHEKVFLPRNCLLNDVLKEICHFWINRSGRDEMCTAKIKYMYVHKHTLDFEDENKTEFTKIKKSRTSRSYMKSQRMIYTKAIRKMHTDFVTFSVHFQFSSDISHFTLHHLTLHHTTLRTEKEPCLCIKCQNVHLLLQGISRYCRTQNLRKHCSVTEFLNSESAINSNNFPECRDTKETSYYIFEIKTESFTKNGKITEYSRTARVDKKEKVCEIVKKLLDRSESYLRHRFHVDNIAALLPMIRESFSGKYIEPNFSENLVLKLRMKFKMLISLENSILFIV